MLKQKRENTYAERHIAKLLAFPHLVESIEHMTLELDILPSKIGHRWLFQQFGIAVILHWIALVEWHLQGSKVLMRSRAAKPGSKCQRCVCDSLPISRTSTLSPAQSIATVAKWGGGQSNTLSKPADFFEVTNGLGQRKVRVVKHFYIVGSARAPVCHWHGGSAQETNPD